PRDPPASHAQLEGLFEQLAQALDEIDFHKGRAPESAMRKLRRLFLRARLDAREVRLLRGVLADAQRMARIANGRDRTSPCVRRCRAKRVSARLPTARRPRNSCLRPSPAALLTCLLGLLAACACAPARAADPHVLVLGRISDDPKAHYEQLKPLLDYVVPRM